ncbi:MAG: flagellar hook-associated protein FlgK, partial [Gaiellaceae bacterium]
MTTTSTFMGLQTALRGILAQQRALDTTAHNIANANTVGYTRQEAQLAPTRPYTEPAVSRPPQAGQIGTGVDVVEFRRIRDEFIDVQLRAQTMRQGYAQARHDGLEQVELTLNEPSDSGLASLISRYWSSWQDVANTPEDIATRQALLQNAAALGDGFRSLDAQLSTIVSQTGQNVTLSIDELNAIGTDLRNLNESIGRSLVVG